MERSDLQGCSATLRVLLIVTAQSAVASPASEHLLDQPSLTLHAEAFLSWFLDSNVQLPTKLFLHLRFKVDSAPAKPSSAQMRVMSWLHEAALTFSNNSNAPARSPVLAGITMLSSQLPPASHNVMRLRPQSFLAPSYPRGPPPRGCPVQSSSRFVNPHWPLSGARCAFERSAPRHAMIPARDPRLRCVANAKSTSRPSSSAGSSWAKNATGNPCDEHKRSRSGSHDVIPDRRVPPPGAAQVRPASTAHHSNHSDKRLSWVLAYITVLQICRCEDRL